MGSERPLSKQADYLLNTPYPSLLICFQSMPRRQMCRIDLCLYYTLSAQDCLASHTQVPYNNLAINNLRIRQL